MKLRKILAVVLALAMVCMTFTACGDDSTSSTTTSSGTTSTETSSGAGDDTSSTTDDGGSAATGEVTLFTRKDVDPSKNLNVRAGMEPTGLNTMLSTYAIEFNLIGHLYETLYVLDENDVPQPGAAEECGCLRRWHRLHLPSP